MNEDWFVSVNELLDTIQLVNCKQIVNDSNNNSQSWERTSNFLVGDCALFGIAQGEK